jgi:hypothetical protein
MFGAGDKWAGMMRAPGSASVSAASTFSLEDPIPPMIGKISGQVGPRFRQLLLRMTRE